MRWGLEIAIRNLRIKIHNYIHSKLQYKGQTEKGQGRDEKEQ